MENRVETVLASELLFSFSVDGEYPCGKVVAADGEIDRAVKALSSMGSSNKKMEPRSSSRDSNLKYPYRVLVIITTNYFRRC